MKVDVWRFVFSIFFQFISIGKRKANSTIEFQKCKGNEKRLFSSPPFKFNFEKSIQRCHNAMKFGVVNKSTILNKFGKYFQVHEINVELQNSINFICLTQIFCFFA